MADLIVKKRGKNVILYENGMLKLENVRFSYPHLDKPYSGKNAKPGTVAKFGIVGMLPKETHVEAKDFIVARINELLQENKVTKMPSKDKFCRNGDDEKEEAYTGHWIVSAREERQPAVRDRRAQLVTQPHEILKLIQGGYWGHMLIRPWFQNNDYGTKVNAGLSGVQFVREDKTFGEGAIDDTNAWAAEEGADAGNGMDDDDGL